MSLLRPFFSLAWTVGPAIGAWLITLWSYQGKFIAASGLFGAFLLGILASVPATAPINPKTSRSDEDPDLNREPKSPLLSPLAAVHRSRLAAVLRHRNAPILYFFAVFVLVFCAQAMSVMTLPLFVIQDLGGTARNVGIIFGLAALMEIPLMVWFAKLADRGHNTLLIRAGVILACGYFAIVPFAHAPWHIYPMQFLIAASIAITTNITILFFQDLMPRQKGLATAIYSNTWSMGSLIGYFAFGLLLPVLGNRGLYFVFAGLTGFGAFMLLTRKSRETSEAQE
jgi:SET family sugar efflux transporter-like MFS transporter